MWTGSRIALLPEGDEARVDMSAPDVAPKRLVIVGATGMVGGYVLRFALGDPGITRVTTVGRRTLGIRHPKLTEVLHQDFLDCAPLSPALTGLDAALFCLG